MEGISIGREKSLDGWFIGLNFKVRAWEDVTGTQLGYNCYEIDEQMTLLHEEVRLTPKLLIKW